jgi:hypothetical protein
LAGPVILKIVLIVAPFFTVSVQDAHTPRNNPDNSQCGMLGNEV